MSNALHDCPFCGAPIQMDHPSFPGTIDVTYFLCDKCGLVASFRPKLKGVAAINAWNSRAPVWDGR